MVVIPSSIFTLVTGIVTQLHTISPGSRAATSIYRCASACYEHEYCGGFVWDAESNPPCEFVVIHSVSGSSPSAAKTAYRLQNFENKRIVRVHGYPQIINWQSANHKCFNNGGLLPPLIVQDKESAQFQIRQVLYFFVDLVRDQNQEYIDSSGTAHDMSVITWASPNPNYGEEKCIGAGSADFLQYYDLRCNNNNNNQYGLLCLL